MLASNRHASKEQENHLSAETDQNKLSTDTHEDSEITLTAKSLPVRSQTPKR
jgi:hypothetical protein